MKEIAITHANNVQVSPSSIVDKLVDKVLDPNLSGDAFNRLVIVSVILGGFYLLDKKLNANIAYSGV